MRNDVDFQNICPSPKFGARIVLLLQEKILKLSWCIKGIFVWCIRGFFPLKFKDQNFISNIYYRKGPSFTTVSRCVRSLAGHPNFTAHFQRAPLLLQQYQGEGNTGVVMFQKSSNIFSSCFILSWKRLL